MSRRTVLAAFAGAALLSLSGAVQAATSPGDVSARAGDAAPSAIHAPWVSGGSWFLGDYNNSARLIPTGGQRAAMLNTSDSKLYVRRTANAGASWSGLARVPVGATNVRTFDTSSSGATIDLFSETLNDKGSALRYQRSTDGGKTWSKSVELANGTYGIVQVARDGAGNVAVGWLSESLAWRVRVSHDGGRNFGPARTAGVLTTACCVFDPGTMGLAVSNGTITAVFATSMNRLVARRSADGGVSWTTAAVLAKRITVGPPALAASGTSLLVAYGAGEDLFVRRSTDAGAHWGSAHRIAAFSYYLAVGRSAGKWSVSFAPFSKIRYAQSGDGVTWAKPQTVDSARDATFLPGSVTTLGGVPAMAYINAGTEAGELLTFATRP